MPGQLRIDSLTATRAVVAKLSAKHNVSVDEVADVVFGRRTQIRRGGGALYLLYGRTQAGRYLFAVIGLDQRRARIVTARDMTLAERRFYGRQKRS